MAQFKDCVATIRQAAPNLTEKQAESLFDEVHDIYEGLKANNNVSDLEAELTRAVEKRVGEEERAAINEKRMRALNYKTRMRFIKKLREIPDEDVDSLIPISWIEKAEGAEIDFSNSATFWRTTTADVRMDAAMPPNVISIRASSSIKNLRVNPNGKPGDVP